MPALVFALLDDRDATLARPSCRLYTGFVREHRCTDPAQLDATWAAVEQDQCAQGLHAVLIGDYEWGAKLVGAGHHALGVGDASALRILLFGSCRVLDRQGADDWLAALEGAAAPGPAGTFGLQASVDADAFTAAIGRIHTAIRAGETYQVNYTYRLTGSAHGTPVALYRRLRARQPVEFGAFIALPPGSLADGARRPPAVAPVAGDQPSMQGGDADTDTDAAAQHYILSCSPELFLRHTGGVLTARPMKGTASRTLAPEGDSETARLLSLDIKNRAENLMIVDLLRNDLGRIAQTGSVRVPALFAIEPYSTVFQMTSTIEARLADGVGFPDVLRATFPCGSITGAPKHHTMQLIAELESTPRGVYCGSIGWIDAPPGTDPRVAPVGPSAPGSAAAMADQDAPDAALDRRRCADFCLSVGIRTLTLGPQAGGARPARLGIGAGIVLDSVAADEFEECQLKGRFLTRLDPGFGLFETLLWLPDGGVQHIAQHLARMAASAATLGFAWDAEAAVRAVQRAVADRSPTAPSRLRLELAVDGRLQAACAPLAPLPSAPIGLIVATQRLPDADPLAAHKTTRRAAYDAGVAAAEQVGAFDSLFLTRDGRLVEGGRSTVFLRLADRWCTPPVADGALPGTARARVLTDPAWAAVERTLSADDLRRADAIMVCNALRGTSMARLA